MNRARALAVLVLLGAVPVAAQEKTTAPTPQADARCPSSSDAVAAVIRRLIEADNARDLQAVLDSYTDDVVFLPPTGEVVLGKAAVAERYRALFAASQPHLTTSVSEVVTSGALAFVRGVNSGRLDSPGGGRPSAVSDNYLAVLSCTVDRWRIARLAWTPRASSPVPDGAVPVEQEAEHKTVFRNGYVQVFRVTLEPGKSTGMHVHAHDDAAVRLSTATMTSDSPGLPAGAPESRPAGFVSARNNEPKALTHQVRNVGTTVFDVIDVQVLKRPDGPEAPPASAPAAENPRLRVYRYELAPGAASAAHAHARPYLLVAATDMNLRMTAPDGRSMAHPIKAGDLHWVDTPVTHTFVNDGSGKGILVEVELK